MSVVGIRRVPFMDGESLGVKESCHLRIKYHDRRSPHESTPES